jgi:hypothetical protein
MATTTMHYKISTNYSERTISNLLEKFFTWCKGQEKNRLLWLGVILMGHGCILTPLIVIAVLLAGTNLFLFVLAIAAIKMSLVTNLAAMPTKITILVFILSILIDFAIIIATIAIGYNISNTYI